jgi:hypothetical protein
MARILVIVLCAVLSSFSTAVAQQLRDTYGSDFWIAVPPNDHSSIGNRDPSMLSVFVVCNEPTTLRFESQKRDGTAFNSTINIPGAAVWELRFETSDYELRGVTIPGGRCVDCEEPIPSSIHVTTSTEVTVYAVIRDDNTSDAWLVLPTDALGTDYVVSTYASSAEADTTFFSRTFTSAFPSQFLVIATEDSTIVTVQLPVNRSASADGDFRSVVLQRGDTYLVQAYVSAQRQNDDLTGSRVRATKPIAVLGAHFRAQVPILTEQASRDCLVEQLPSTDVWGKRVVVPPLVPPSDIRRTSQRDVALVRILASSTKTGLTINGNPVAVLGAGAYLDVPLVDEPLDIIATEPILVTIIDRSANRQNGAGRSGDPSLIVVPPVEQFLSSYRVTSIEPRQSGAAFYTQHQITCIVPMSHAASLTLDGAPAPAAVPIPGTTLGFVHAAVNNGRHTAVCDTTFGIIVYGYGPAESYGYTGGMAFERLYRPVVTLRALDRRGRPGVPDTLYCVIDSISNEQEVRLSGARSARGSISFDATMFVPVDVQGIRRDSLRSHVQWEYTFDSLVVGDTVVRVPGTHVLGSDTASVIDIYESAWYAGNGDSLFVRSDERDGVLRTDGVCIDGTTPRLFDPTRPLVPRQRRYYDIRGRYIGSSLEGQPPGVYFER